jgi:hypothetical protein
MSLAGTSTYMPSIVPKKFTTTLAHGSASDHFIADSTIDVRTKAFDKTVGHFNVEVIEVGTSPRYSFNLDFFNYPTRYDNDPGRVTSYKSSSGVDMDGTALTVDNTSAGVFSITTATPRTYRITFYSYSSLAPTIEKTSGADLPGALIINVRQWQLGQV